MMRGKDWQKQQTHRNPRQFICSWKANVAD
uniref:Uncharacterized protein n=1 Tax=Anguilla anguilla TaxID=7936 RepID=A0A0E9U7C3_ANGAN